ncbi:hypothetical protein P3W43_02965 [Salinicola salarius]|uniref:hypothetical protein n=1 Tax=Salinicola salarius TaxID=430457 RepID=UPI0023E3C3F7|nr:hypothetical protein [Salinicola salarius]MDF3917815.1 hypothetical protein [Salinicola salarius]
MTGIAFPWLNDQPFRLRQLREVLRELADYPRGQGAWWTTPGAIADYASQRS